MELRQKMADMGYFGIRMPEEHGGLGLGVFEYCLIAEELARGWMSVASIIARASSLMAVGGWPEDKRRELTAQSGPGRISGRCRPVRAERRLGPGSRELPRGAGRQRVGDHGQQILVHVRRRRRLHPAAGAGGNPGEPNARYAGLRSFIIEKPRGELPQGCSGSPIPKIGYFGWKTWELAFDGCRIPKENIITGGDSEGFKNTVSFLNAARAHTAARSIGLARGALEDAMAYAHERVQFGVPIADFQETRFKIARMASEIEAARQLMYHCATLMDNGEPADKEAAMVKWFASEMAERVTSEALQILGGAGYTKLHAVERYWRDARLTKIFEGTSEIQLRIISDRLLGKPTQRANA